VPDPDARERRLCKRLDDLVETLTPADVTYLRRVTKSNRVTEAITSDAVLAVLQLLQLARIAELHEHSLGPGASGRVRAHLAARLAAADTGDDAGA
jgi:hypothetical protein